MALNERQRAQIRGALEAVLRAEVADEAARAGNTDDDVALDAAAALLRELVPVLERLAGAGR